MDVVDAVADNPILVKHLRARLRPAQALPWVAVVVVLAASVVYAGHYVPWLFGDRAAVKTLIGFQVFLLAFVGSNQINTSLGGARESGILDFHRVSPVPPYAVALGFLLGGPAREYVLAAVLLPFILLSASLVDAGDPWLGPRMVVQIEVALLTTAWVVHALAMLGALTRKRPRGSVLGGIATVVFLLFLLYLGSIGLYFGTDWLFQEDRALNFFGRMVPWLAWLLVNEVPLLGFLGLAVSRKIGAERAHAYSKPQALACMVTLTTLIVGTLWDVSRLMPPTGSAEPTPADVVTIAAIYVLSLLAMILAVTITPDAGEYVKGVRRAGRAGRRRPGAWTDAGSNRLALFALCAIVLVGASTAVNVVGAQRRWESNPRRLIGMAVPNTTREAWLASRQAMASRPIVVGVLTVAYVGLALQFFSLRTRTSGMTLLALFLFVTWLVPLTAGAIVGMGGPDQTRALTVMALSPIMGLGLSSGLGSPAGVDAIRLAALAPPITFAFVFNSLVVFAQRRIDRQVHAGEKARAPEAPRPEKAPGVDP